MTLATASSGAVLMERFKKVVVQTGSVRHDSTEQPETYEMKAPLKLRWQTSKLNPFEATALYIHSGDCAGLLRALGNGSSSAALSLTVPTPFSEKFVLKLTRGATSFARSCPGAGTEVQGEHRKGQELATDVDLPRI